MGRTPSADNVSAAKEDNEGDPPDL